MKIIHLPQGGGKTEAMLVWLLEGHVKGIDRALIVRDGARVDRLRSQLQSLYKANGEPKYINDAANRIYSIHRLINMGVNHFRNCEVGVDDADEILSYLLFGRSHRPVSILSLTADPEGTDKA